MAFTASTREVCAALGIHSPKTLLKRRLDPKKGAAMIDEKAFLLHGKHWRFKSPVNPRVTWDLEQTVEVWNNATAIYNRAFG